MSPTSGTFCIPPDRPALLIHGGAWAIPVEEHESHREGLHRALRKGQELLQKGAPALEVVTEVVAVMEAHPAFDAGRGSVLNRKGEVELDAGVMDGKTRLYGAVAGVKHFLHPVRIARRILEKGNRATCFLVGEGAEVFALQEGFPFIPNEALIIEREWNRYRQLRESAQFHPSIAFHMPDEPCPKDTVGAVARDRQGHLAAATSTGGTPMTWPGRVGDSPLPGAGYYANRDIAISTTGWGEAIAAMVLAKAIEESFREGLSPEEAARYRLRELFETIQNDCARGATAGVIVLTATRGGSWAFTTPHMARGGWCEGKAPWVAI